MKLTTERAPSYLKFTSYPQHSVFQHEDFSAKLISKSTSKSNAENIIVQTEEFATHPYTSTNKSSRSSTRSSKSKSGTSNRSNKRRQSLLYRKDRLFAVII